MIAAADATVAKFAHRWKSPTAVGGRSSEEAASPSLMEQFSPGPGPLSAAPDLCASLQPPFFLGDVPAVAKDPAPSLHAAEALTLREVALEAFMEDLSYQAYSHFLAHGTDKPFAFSLAGQDVPTGFEEVLKRQNIRRLEPQLFALDCPNGTSAALKQLKDASAQGVRLLQWHRPLDL